jgi:hypothetical protein
MAAPTNTFTKYDAVGNREDLSDTIYNISPTETPFVTNADKKKADNTFFEWQTDALAAAVTTNAQVEGDVVTSAAITPTTRVGNYTQILHKPFTISGTNEAVKKAGRKSEQAYQMAKQGKELKRDMEATFTSKQVGVSGGNTTARKTAAFDSWLKTNRNNGNGGTGDYAYTTTPITARTAATTGNIRTWTETIFKDVISQSWTSGGEADTVLVGAFQKGKASGFAGIADQRHETGEKNIKIIGGADVYVSDFGNLAFLPDRFMPADLAYHVDFEHVSIATLRPFHDEELAKTADGRNFVIRVEAGLQVDNEAAHGVARDLATS